jgi:uncharacterized Fe-S cluster-containing radical SAM superfamily protein
MVYSAASVTPTHLSDLCCFTCADVFMQMQIRNVRCGQCTHHRENHDWATCAAFKRPFEVIEGIGMEC